MAKKAARKIETAILAVLSEGKVRTADLNGSSTTTRMTEAITSRIKQES